MARGEGADETVTGRKSRSSSGSPCWMTMPPSTPMHAAEQAHACRLQQVDGEDLARRGAEAAQHGDGIELPADEHRHGARDAEPAQEQCHERDEAEIVAEPVERLGEVVAILLDRADAHALRAQRVRKRSASLMASASAGSRT